MEIEFKEFPKIARLLREAVITEKIDGTNGQIYISEDKRMEGGGDIRKSCEINRERFKISDQLYRILLNTVNELGW